MCLFVAKGVSVKYLWLFFCRAGIARHILTAEEIWLSDQEDVIFGDHYHFKTILYMRQKLSNVPLLFLGVLLSTCTTGTDQKSTENSFPIEGTWQLISGTLVEKGDTTLTDYTVDRRMIKILNKTHFSFLNHDLQQGKDSTASFIAGGGTYTLNGDQYTEYLEYCSDRSWEGNTFAFTVKLQGDTLIQQGVEKIENLGVERLNIEKYKKVKE